MNHGDVKYPKVLVISHNCFSKSGSNGRTISNFFINWPKESIAQFYIIDEIPDVEICSNYFRVTDIEVLKAFYKKANVGIQIVNQNVKVECGRKDEKLSKLYKRSKKRTPISYIVRNIIWDSSRWKSDEFVTWVNEFNPNIVLLQLGDYAFMIRIALDIATKRNIPLIIYSSEDYYFKDKKTFSPFYNYYRYDYKNQIKKLFKYLSYSIYNSYMLRNTYLNEFKHQCIVIMTSTNITPIEDKKINSPIIVSYLGSLGVGRHEPLIEIAETVHKLNQNVYLDIYGKIPNNDVKKALYACSGVRFMGFVAYDEVTKIMRKSDVLVHAENFSEFYKWDLKHAFSTKISDCLGSGSCLFVYAPNNMAFTKYLLENKAAFVVTDKNNLEESLKNILEDNELRQSIINNSLLAAHNHHDANTNAERFREIVFEVAKDR